MIFDEVQCGLGRSGTLWAYEHSGVEPDIMTLPEPLAGGLPIGAVLLNRRPRRISVLVATGPRSEEVRW